MAKAAVSLGTGLQATINAGNHTFYADEPVDDGGTDTGAAPTEIFMGALGACIAMTMRLYADRKGWTLEGVDINLEMERFSGKDYANYEGDERFVHEIREEITLHGDLDEAQRERLLDIAKKCPVARAIATPTFWKQTLLEADAQPE